MIGESAIPSRPRSVLLTDWAAKPDDLRADREAIVYQLLLLSLLYDEILIQDEIVVLSNPLAEWFGDQEGRKIWEELLDIGSIVILKHPIGAYPTEELREYSRDHPIEARAKYIEKFGTKGDQHFVASDHHRKFYSTIEWSLMHGGCKSREVGAHRPIEIMPLFSHVLMSVLSETSYSTWLRSRFPVLRRQDAEDYHRLIADTEHLVKLLRAKGALKNIVRDQNDRPVLNRSLAFQAASLFPEPKRVTFQQLIQSTFVAPFCWRERAIGRYGGGLKAVPPPVKPSTGSRKRRKNRNRGREAIGIIEAHVEVPLVMPKLERGFGKAVAEVRESPEGKALREAVSGLARSVTFDEQRMLWEAVAAELARKLAGSTGFGISLYSVARKLAEGAVLGAIAHKLIHPAEDELLTWLLGGAVAGVVENAMGIIFDPIHALWREKSAQELCGRLENAIDFRCTWIEEPPRLSEDDASVIYFPKVDDE